MNHPHLTELFKIYQSESQPFRKVHRMIDLFESIIKSHTVVIIAEYVKHNKLSEAAKGMLAQGLRTPSLGTWQLFSRILSEELNADGYAWTFTGFPEDFASLDKALNATKTNVISFRNGYAHGATPTDEQCESDIRQFEPFLIQLLDSHWLSNTTLENRDNKVWIVSDNGELCLHPIFLSKDEGGSSPYAFFNDLKNDKVGLLNYPLSKHYREKQFYQEFQQYLPLNEWKKSGNNEFYQRIEELTETFKGRTQERARLLDFVSNNNKGYFSIQGNPGIGKSALIAQFFKDLKSHKETQQLQVVEYFIRRGTAQAQVEYVFNYLLRRTDELFAAGKEIRAEGKAVWDLQQQLFSKWRLWGEQSKGGKLLFLIDGLDEGVENSVVTYLPRENFEDILIIYGSRPGGHKSIDDLWGQLPVEHHTKLELSGLGKEDIRALIYEVANKYELDRDSAWIDAVQRRSEGNPLYLKLLCDAMEHGSIVVNDIGALPEKIDEYYKAILDRYSRDTDGDALLSGLFTFAAARDYLTMTHLGLINKMGEATVQRIGSTLKEVLYENPLTEDVLDYQLFHESFREYLVKEKGANVREAAERIIDFCEGWKEMEGTWEQRYALEHYAAHLSESKKELRVEILSRLIYDHGYTATQKKVLKGFDASNEMYRIALKKSCELKREDDMLEAALCLVDLKYEEANDAPQIVAMVANGDIDLALKRIESFGGVDAEGMKRKFILYMLCLMELTLLDSKDKPFRKSAIEKLLNHLDENIPVDHSLLNWDDFFSSYLMFKMACEWAGLGLNYILVYKRTDEWRSDWIINQGPYTDPQWDLLIECGTGIIDKRAYSKTFKFITIELANQGKLKDALIYVDYISGEHTKSHALTAISSGLAKQGMMEESINCLQSISDEGEKINAIASISGELVKHGNLKEAVEKINQALVHARKIRDNRNKSIALKEISNVLAKLNRNKEAVLVIQEALSSARRINKEVDIIFTIGAISTVLVEQSNVQESSRLMNELILKTRDINGFKNKNIALKLISIELAKQGKIEEAFDCAREIDNIDVRRIAFESIFVNLVKYGKVGKISEIVKEMLIWAIDIKDDMQKSRLFSTICSELTKQARIEDASAILYKNLYCSPDLDSIRNNNSFLVEISSKLSNESNIEEILNIVTILSSENEKGWILANISLNLYKQGKLVEASATIKEALSFVKGISSEIEKSRLLRYISLVLAKHGKLDNASIVLNEALGYARSIESYTLNCIEMMLISVEMAQLGNSVQALECAKSIINNEKRTIALASISTEFAKQSKHFESSEVMQEAIACAREIGEVIHKSRALKVISSELTKQGKIEVSSAVILELVECAMYISNHRFKSITLADISSELVKLGNVERAELIMGNAIDCAFAIKDGKMNHRNSALSYISINIANQDNFKLAEKICMEITRIADRHKCWKKIASTTIEQYGLEISLFRLKEFEFDEARLFYLKGWTEAINFVELNNIFLNKALRVLFENTDAIEEILKKYAYNLVLSGKSSQQIINRLNQTLNIHWVLDVVARFPLKDTINRILSYLSEWIDLVQDEDDRDQISLWAKQVAKGKISEAEFEEKVKSINLY